MKRLAALFLLLISLQSTAIVPVNCDEQKEEMEYEAANARGIEISIAINYLGRACDLVNIQIPKSIEGYSNHGGVGIEVYSEGKKVIETGISGGENSLGKISFPLVACSYVDHLKIGVSFGKYCSSKEITFSIKKKDGAWPKNVIVVDDAIPRPRP